MTRCETHGLAAAPDGLCELCRRRTDPPSEAPSRGTVGLVTLVAGLGLLLATHFAVKVFEPPPAGANSAAPGIAPEARAEAEPVASAKHETAPLPPLPARSTSAAPQVLPTASAPGETAATSSASPAVASASSTATRPSAAQLAQALKATNVVMFSTSWCPVCTRARAFLNANGIPFEERDIDRNPTARDELKRRTGKASIPLLVIDGQQLEPGFSESAVMKAVSASLKRRLGVEDLHVRRTR
jgi:glutaredoxin 3